MWAELLYILYILYTVSLLALHTESNLKVYIYPKEYFRFDDIYPTMSLIFNREKHPASASYY